MPTKTKRPKKLKRDAQGRPYSSDDDRELDALFDILFETTTATSSGDFTADIIMPGYSEDLDRETGFIAALRYDNAVVGFIESYDGATLDITLRRLDIDFFGDIPWRDA